MTFFDMKNTINGKVFMYRNRLVLPSKMKSVLPQNTEDEIPANVVMNSTQQTSSGGGMNELRNKLKQLNIKNGRLDKRKSISFSF